jgi:hypothetical protein
MESTDYSSCVERFEAMEERLGIELSSVGASTNNFDNFYIQGEILSRDGGRLHAPITIQAAAYNADGKAIAFAEVSIDQQTFGGFEIFQIYLGTNLPDVRKVRVFPKASG